eukprot:CAMPEP_0113552556 /NCGR_PEP_ID=MMETSP0015_2-20120614/15131_1 /TAXON_ID=2838 /ORGANISM="Odontella" /LENGTH=783 /DNA_ID=CAMNT_0000453543 /DNA_START=282 /DNA_END=2629 /DNA_ORIENTATION=+ /assembly_acc=CAM_ASM_000160
MDLDKDLEPQEFHYDDLDDDGRSDDGEDDIIYAENENDFGDNTLKWTTSSTFQALHDDDATHRSAGSQSQFSQSRSTQRALPSLITRKERRLLRRQQVEKHEVIDFSEASGQDSGEHQFSQNCGNMDEEGDEVFASIRNFIDKKELTGHSHLSRRPTGLETDSSTDNNKADRGLSGDRSNSQVQTINSICGLDPRMSPSAELDSAEDSRRSIQKGHVGNANDESSSFQIAMTVNGQCFDSGVLRQEPSTSSLAHGRLTLKSTNERFCDRGSGKTHERGDRYDCTGFDCLPAEVEQVPGLSQSVVHSECCGERRKIAKIRDNKNMDRVAQSINAIHHPEEKAKEKCGPSSNCSENLLDSQETLLLAARNNRKRRNNMSTEYKGSKVAVVPRFPSSQSRFSAGIKTHGEQSHTAKTRSIVGSRPLHWSGFSTNLTASRKGIHKSKSTSARATALSQATRMRIPPPPSRSEGNKKRRKLGLDVPKIGCQLPMSSTDSEKNTNLIRNCRKRLPSLTQLSQSSASDMQQAYRDSGWKENADVRCVEFAPSFFVRPKTTEVNSCVVVTSPDAAVVKDTIGTRSPFGAKSAILQHHSSYIKQSSRSSSSRKKKQSGLLMAKLRRIRSTVDGDNVRFQSGAYPFRPSKCRSDMNDPRNRAESHADVTIVGKPFPWSNGEKRLTVLGYVHFACSKKKLNGSTASGSLLPSGNATTAGSKYGSREDLSTINFPCFLWLCFTFDTAHAQKVGHNVPLRIYNAVVIGSQCGEKTLPTALCTQICEPYPEDLPALP